MSIYECLRNFISTITSNEDVSMILEIMSSGVLLAFFQSIISVSRLIINARELKRGKKQKYLYNKIGLNFLGNYCIKISALGLELAAIVVYYILFIALAYVAILCMNICSWINNKYIVTWIIVVILSMLFWANKKAKDDHNMHKRVAIIALMFAESIIIAVHINTIKTNEMLLIAVIVIEALILTMIYASNISRFLKKYFRENKIIKGIGFARYCILPCLTLNAIITVGSGIVDELVMLWGILWGLNILEIRVC